MKLKNFVRFFYSLDEPINLISASGCASMAFRPLSATLKIAAREI
jgi:hypothetical protein